jgi:glycosyltransferase involved in cell wall biosynthesis
VTRFNQLMWDCGRSPTTVVEHGVRLPEPVVATAERARGVVVANELPRRGRRFGADLVERWRAELPLDLVGMGNAAIGGCGEVPPPQLAAHLVSYRFFLHPARFTSLGLAVIEAMMVGLPILALAVTEMPTVITSRVNGYLSTDPAALTAVARELLADRDLARAWGEAARCTAEERFGIDRFVADWLTLFERIVP